MDTLRVAVGFKVTPDYEALRPADWARAAGPPTGEAADPAFSQTGPPGPPGPEVRFVRRVLDVFDEAALEVALRLRDARAERGLTTGLAAFTIGGREADPFLATLQALGFERACRVEAGADLDFAPATTARLAAACAERLGGDVLLLGAQSGPGDGGVVPFLAAEALGRPCISGVTEIETLHDGRLRATFATDGGPARAAIRLPCVLAVGNALVSMLRVPTLKDRLAARDRSAQVLAPQDIGVDVTAALASEPSALVELESVVRCRAGRVVTGATPEDMARALFDAELRPRLARLEAP